MNRSLMTLIMAVVPTLVGMMIWVNQADAFRGTHQTVQKNVPSSITGGALSSGSINGSSGSVNSNNPGANPGSATQHPVRTKQIHSCYSGCFENCGGFVTAGGGDSKQGTVVCQNYCRQQCGIK